MVREGAEAAGLLRCLHVISSKTFCSISNQTQMASQQASSKERRTGWTPLMSMCLFSVRKIRLVVPQLTVMGRVGEMVLWRWVTSPISLLIKGWALITKLCPTSIEKNIWCSINLGWVAKSCDESLTQTWSSSITTWFNWGTLSTLKPPKTHCSVIRNKKLRCVEWIKNSAVSVVNTPGRVRASSNAYSHGIALPSTTRRQTRSSTATSAWTRKLVTTAWGTSLSTYLERSTCCKHLRSAVCASLPLNFFESLISCSLTRGILSLVSSQS